jgi:hypothetical protein
MNLATKLALLFSSTSAIKVRQCAAPSKHGLISIDIDAVDYVPERVSTILA